MTSRERVRAVLNHQMPDRIPLDLGGTMATGISASTCAKLRAALGLSAGPLKIIEPLQLLGEVGPDLRELYGIDVIGIDPPSTIFGMYNHLACNKEIKVYRYNKHEDIPAHWAEKFAWAEKYL